MLLMHFSAIFGMLAVLATSVTRGTHSEGCEWGCCDSIYLLGYERTFFAACSIAEGRSEPGPKTQNGCFHRQWVTEVNGPVHNLQFFTLGSSKIEVEVCFYDIVTT